MKGINRVMRHNVRRRGAILDRKHKEVQKRPQEGNGKNDSPDTRKKKRAYLRNPKKQNVH